MALIERHPDVEDYFLELTLPEIAARGGVADLVEEGKLILIKDYRLDVDFAAIEGLTRTTEAIDDANLRRQIKKLEAPHFFDGTAPRWTMRGRKYDDPLRQALLDVLCRGDRALFDRVGTALHDAHDEALRLFESCFAGYEPYRLVPSVRLTETLFENLHWDDHSIDDDFHQARIFANLDSRPRIWHVSHRITEMMRRLYDEHALGRFAGQDPNKMLFYINSTVLGGQKKKWLDAQPRHRIAFDPGEVWLGESRLLSHQIYYGQSALVYMWFVRASSMKNPDNRFNVQVEKVHAEMRAR
jgi:hypothetical protein